MTTADLGEQITAAITTRHRELTAMERKGLNHNRLAWFVSPLSESVGRERATLDALETIAGLHIYEPRRCPICEDAVGVYYPCDTLRAVATGLGLTP